MYAFLGWEIAHFVWNKQNEMCICISARFLQRSYQQEPEIYILGVLNTLEEFPIHLFCK